jgi:hypothetical protein
MRGQPGRLGRFGGRAMMPQLLTVLAGDCERLKAGKIHDPCGALFPELPRLFGVKVGPCRSGHRGGRMASAMSSSRPATAFTRLVARFQRQ